MIVYIVLSRLPTDVQSRFELYHGVSADDLPTSSQLVNFLEEECRRAETMGSFVKSPAEPQITARRGFQQRHENKKVVYGHVRAGTPDKVACPYCRQVGHGVTNCNQFKDQRIQGRRHTANQRGWCFLCLGQHMARDCARPKLCAFCGGRHHELLCMNRSGQRHDDGQDRIQGQEGPRTQGRTQGLGQGGSYTRGRTQDLGRGGPFLQDRTQGLGQGGPMAHERSREEFGADVQANIAGCTPTHWNVGKGNGPVTGGCMDAPLSMERALRTPPRVASCSPPIAGFRRFSPPVMERPRLDHRTPPLRGRRPVQRRDMRGVYEGSRDPFVGFVGFDVPRQYEGGAWGPGGPR